jgi:hydrogenase-4 component F
MPNEINSVLPILVMSLPAAAGVLIFVLGGFVGRLREVLALAGIVGALVCSVLVGAAVLRNQVLTSFGRQIYADAFSAFLIVLVSAIGLLAVVYSVRYMRHQVREGGLPHTTTEGRLTAFYGWLMLFIATMLWACLSNNIIMLYVAVEASTIASGLLVAFYWDRRSLEAGYKYLMLLTVGITFALFGCVLVYANATSMPGMDGSRALLISDIKSVAKNFPSTTVALAAAFLIVGFGTKAGLAPFHPWLPDAHAEAPTPVSALLSGVMLKVAIYAMVRTVTLFYPSFPPIAVFALALGVFTLLIGDFMALAQDDLKRMLAYSSVSQMGYVLMGFGIGTTLGTYAALFHLLNHALGKSLLFLAAGAVIYSTGVRSISHLGGVAKKMPVTGFCFFVGALAVAGLPPFNGFQSKLALFTAGARAHYWWAVILGIGASLLTLLVLAKAARTVFWGKSSDAVSVSTVREAPATVLVPMILIAVLCLGIGIYPGAVYKPLSAAAKMVQTVGYVEPIKVNASEPQNGPIRVCTRSR